MSNTSPTTRALEGKRVVITGGARGIGAEIAEVFSRSGATVAILDILEAAGIAHGSTIGASFFAVDLSDLAATRAVLEQAIAELGGIDILVNNAGILRFAPLLEMAVTDWDETFAINVRPMLVTTQIAAKTMIAAGAGGKIINIASMAGKSGGAGQAHYAASKAAVIALTRVSALELGEHGITANSICPGYVLTEMGAATRTADDVAEWSSYSPLGRLGTADDVAGVALFLASGAADYMTGQSINITGGMIMH
ncbi:SDR family NAD(P)-dependent oxidoreductase [soil metagenome]